MATNSATFCNVSLSTTYDRDSERSVLSLDWVLCSGIRAVRSQASGILTIPSMDGIFSIQMNLPVVSALPFDLVLGRDWSQYCQDSISEPYFYLSYLSSGEVDLWRRQTGNSATPYRCFPSWTAYCAPQMQSA